MRTVRSGVWQMAGRLPEATHNIRPTFSLLFTAILVLLLEHFELFYALDKRCLLPSACCVLQGSAAALSADPQRPSKLPPAPLDINRASAEDFQKLPGVGPKLAQQIVAYRQKHGPFRRIEDLMVVKGVGIKKWKAMRPYLRAGNPEKTKGLNDEVRSPKAQAEGKK